MSTTIDMYYKGTKYNVVGEHFMGSDVVAGYINNNYYEYKNSRLTTIEINWILEGYTSGTYGDVGGKSGKSKVVNLATITKVLSESETFTLGTGVTYTYNFFSNSSNFDFDFYAVGNALEIKVSNIPSDYKLTVTRRGSITATSTQTMATQYSYTDKGDYRTIIVPTGDTNRKILVSPLNLLDKDGGTRKSLLSFLATLKFNYNESRFDITVSK